LSIGFSAKKIWKKPPYKTVVITFDATGSPYSIPIEGKGKKLIFCSPKQTVQPSEEQPKATDLEFDGMLVRALTPEPVMTPENCCQQRETTLAELEEYAKRWVDSPSYSRLMSYVVKNAPRAAEVKQLVCFGLGRLRPDFGYQGLHIATCYIQHTAAIHMRDLIAQKQGKDKTSIPIYVQDGECGDPR
jgi:hypothetical protein